MLDGWQGDPDVEAWLVPINPVPIRPLDALLSVKYLRTVVTQLLYWPLLVRELRRADVVHVFSASYSSFLLAPLPAIVDREAAGTAGHPELSQRRSAGSSAPLRAGPARHARLGGSERRPLDVPARRARVVRHSARRSSPTPSICGSSRTGCATRCGRGCSRPATSSRSTTWPCTLRAFARVQARYPDATLTLVGSDRRTPSLRALAAALSLAT